MYSLKQIVWICLFGDATFIAFIYLPKFSLPFQVFQNNSIIFLDLDVSWNSSLHNYFCDKNLLWTLANANLPPQQIVNLVSGGQLVVILIST